MALHDLSTFTRMLQAGTFKSLPVETRNVLTRRLSPSINETERHAVRCLVFTEHPDNGRSSLWCAYGSKLKVFNVTTWICDPTDVSFPSTITCMCLDARYKLWVGCIQGQLFVVDTITRMCSEQQAAIDGDGGCQTIAFDSIRNHILTANRSGVVTIWNASNWERLDDINLCEIYKAANTAQQRTFKSEAVVTLRQKAGPPIIEKNQNRKNTLCADSNESLNHADIPGKNIYIGIELIDYNISLIYLDIPSASGPAEVIPSSTDKLERLQIYEDLLFACYRNDYMLILRISDPNTYTFEHLISVKYKAGESVPIDSFCVYNKQVWASTGSIIHIFDVNNKNSYSLLMKKPVDDDHLSVMLGFSNYIWAGSLSGNVYIYRMDNYELYKTFAGHHGSVCCLCSMLDMYVVSGSAQSDTSIAIWENVQTTNGGATPAAAIKRSSFSTHGKSKAIETSRETDTTETIMKPFDILQ
jgi:WD40 repeat protein